MPANKEAEHALHKRLSQCSEDLAHARERIDELESHQRLLVALLQKTREDLVEIRKSLSGDVDAQAMFAIRGIAETLNQVTGEAIPDEDIDGWKEFEAEVERLRAKIRHAIETLGVPASKEARINDTASVLENALDAAEDGGDE